MAITTSEEPEVRAGFRPMLQGVPNAELPICHGFGTKHLDDDVQRIGEARLLVGFRIFGEDGVQGAACVAHDLAGLGDLRGLTGVGDLPECGGDVLDLSE